MKHSKQLVILFLLIGLCGCASARLKKCSDLAGPGWTPLAAPPANAADLLALENLPGGSEVIWFANGPQRALACYYAAGLNNPSCSGTTAYEFAEKDGQWASRSLRSEVCPTDSDS